MGYLADMEQRGALKKAHQHRLLHLISDDIQGAYYRETGELNLSTGQPVLELFVPPVEDVEMRVRAWKDAGVQLSMSSFDAGTGEAHFRVHLDPFRIATEFSLNLTQSR